MAVREEIKRYNRAMMGVAIAAIVLSVAYIGNHLIRGGHPPVPYFPDKAFYTSDDVQLCFPMALGRSRRSTTTGVRRYAPTCSVAMEGSGDGCSTSRNTVMTP